MRLSFREVEIDLEARRATTPRGAARLTEREVETLRYLAERSGEVVLRERLERDVWRFRAGVRSEAVPVTIRRLRAKIERTPDAPEILLTVQGRGWRIAREPRARAVPPSFATPFVGRDEHLEALRRWFAAGHRVVCLVGPGGAGKTRLAAEIARSEVGSAYVDLDGCASDRVVAVAGRAIGVGGLATVADLAALLGGERLIVLDNAEGAEPGVAALVAAAIRAAPELRVLVGSRRPLGLSGEVVHEVGGLGGVEAERLLVDRVRAAGGPAPSPDRCRAFVRAVDGLPLALEVCAGLLARRPDATPAELEPSLRGAVDGSVRWSLAQLSPDERGFLADCTVFPAGFDLESARRVLGDGADAGLEALRRAWLMGRREGRHHLTPAARATIPQSPGPATVGAYRGWLLDEIVRLTRDWESDPAHACDRAAELRVDLERAIGGEDRELSARAALALCRWGDFDGPRDAGAWLDRVQGPLPPRLEAEVALSRAVYAVDLGDRERLATLNAALGGPEDRLEWADLEVGRRLHFVVVATATGRHEQTAAWLPLVEPGADVPADVRCHAALWSAHAARMASNLAESDRALAEGYATSVRAGLPAHQATFLALRAGLLTKLGGDPHRACRMLERAIELAIHCRRPTTAVTALLNLRVEWLVRDPARAAACSARAVELAQTVAARVTAAFSLGMDRYLAGDPEGGLEAIEPWWPHVGRVAAASAEQMRLYHATLLAATGATDEARARFEALDRPLLRRAFATVPTDEVERLVGFLESEIDRTEARRGLAGSGERADAVATEVRGWADRQPRLYSRLLPALLAMR